MAYGYRRVPVRVGDFCKISGIEYGKLFVQAFGGHEKVNEMFILEVMLRLVPEAEIGVVAPCKLFKEYTGLSPARYILEIKMAKARELLTNTDM